MLKQPLPGRARSAVGLGLAALLVLGGSIAAWASQPPSVSAHATSADAAAHDVAVTTASSPDHGIRYGKRYALAYPASAPVPGSCVAIVTLKIDASGAIADLAALTMHGDAPKAECGKWTRNAAASIMRKPWRFDPAMAHGKPVPAQAIVPIVFTSHATDTFDTSLIPNGALAVIRVSR